MNSRNLGLIVLVAAVAAVAAFFVVRGDRKAELAAADAKLAALFPGLEGKINDIASVSIETSAGRTTAELKDGRWALKEKSGYPIDAAKVREIVLSLASMKNLEPRTSRADQFKTIGVEDVKPAAGGDPDPSPDAPPPDAAAKSALVTMSDKDGKALAAVIVGNTKYESSGKQGVYVRKPGETTSYLADMGARRFDVPRQATSWIETKFADITRDRVWSVTVTPREGGEAEAVTVRKEAPASGAFTIQGIPAGRELQNPGAAETFASALASSTFEDVASVSTIDFEGSKSGKPGAAVRIRTWDGLIVDVGLAEQDGKTWWKLAASADPEPFKEAPPTPPPAADGSTPPVAAAEPKPRRTPEEVAKEVAELNAKWAPWAFAAPSYKSSTLNTRMSDQLKEPPAAPTPPAPTPGAPVPTAPNNPQ